MRSFNLTFLTMRIIQSSVHNQLSAVIFLLILSISSSNTCDFNVKIKQLLHNEGFHRNMSYSIVFQNEDTQERKMFSSCLLGVEQELPAGIYANPDELGDLRRTHKINAIPKNRVNVELPTEQSSTTSVYIIGKVLDSYVYTWLPVHARYHQAVPRGGFARNDIPPPKLYLRCPDERLNACDRNVKKAVSFLCSGNSKEKCDWREIPYTLMTDTPYWDVPVGNTDHYYVVAIGTALVIAVGSLYILKAVHDYKIGASKKKQ